MKKIWLRFLRPDEEFQEEIKCGARAPWIPEMIIVTSEAAFAAMPYTANDSNESNWLMINLSAKVDKCMATPEKINGKEKANIFLIISSLGL